MNLGSFTRQHFLQSVSFFAIGLVLMLLANNAINFHMHVLDNGFVVTHAHPFDKTSDNELPKKHKHSPQEILFFSGLSILFTCLLLIIDRMIHELVSFSIPYHALPYSNPLSGTNSGRSPPLA